MKLTDFWERMERHFGVGYARSWAHDMVLEELGGRTVEAALAAGDETLDVWRAVWRHERMDPRER